MLTDGRLVKNRLIGLDQPSGSLPMTFGDAISAGTILQPTRRPSASLPCRKAQASPADSIRKKPTTVSGLVCKLVNERGLGQPSCPLITKPHLAHTSRRWWQPGAGGDTELIATARALMELVDQADARSGKCTCGASHRLSHSPSIVPALARRPGTRAPPVPRPQPPWSPTRRGVPAVAARQRPQADAEVPRPVLG